MKKFQGDTGVSETMPTLHRDTRKHPYGNPKWRNLRMSLGFDGMNDNQKKRYIEDRDAIAKWNNRPISELTEEEQVFCLDVADKNTCWYNREHCRWMIASRSEEWAGDNHRARG